MGQVYCYPKFTSFVLAFYHLLDIVLACMLVCYFDRTFHVFLSCENILLVCTCITFYLPLTYSINE